MKPPRPRHHPGEEGRRGGGEIKHYKTAQSARPRRAAEPPAEKKVGGAVRGGGEAGLAAERRLRGVPRPRGGGLRPPAAVGAALRGAPGAGGARGRGGQAAVGVLGVCSGCAVTHLARGCRGVVAEVEESRRGGKGV